MKSETSLPKTPISANDDSMGYESFAKRGEGSQSLRLTRAKSTLVYFIRGHITGLIKIGIANDAKFRLRQLQGCSPDKLELLGVIEAEKPAVLEEQLHAQFQKWHSHGEWFQPHMDIFRYIQANAVSGRGAGMGALNRILRGVARRTLA